MCRTKREIIKNVILKESGYSNHKDDLGGETMFGITKNLARQHTYEGNMMDIPIYLAADIYEMEFWDRMNLDEVMNISNDLCYLLLDCAVNCGPYFPVSSLQRGLNILNKKGVLYDDITVDGILGSQTIKSINSLISIRKEHGITVLMKIISCFKGMHYIEICEKRENNESFIYGWFNRFISLDMEFYHGHKEEVEKQA